MNIFARRKAKVWLVECVIRVVDFESEIVENHKCTSDKCTSKGTKLVGAGLASRPLSKIALS